jgi:hypothetical protein
MFELTKGVSKSVGRTGIECVYNRIAKVDHAKLGGLWELSLGEIEGSRASAQHMVMRSLAFIDIQGCITIIR